MREQPGIASLQHPYRAAVESPKLQRYTKHGPGECSPGASEGTEHM